MYRVILFMIGLYLDILGYLIFLIAAIWDMYSKFY